jgi:hypothetical protein
MRKDGRRKTEDGRRKHQKYPVTLAFRPGAVEQIKKEDKR